MKTPNRCLTVLAALPAALPAALLVACASPGANGQLSATDACSALAGVHLPVTTLAAVHNPTGSGGNDDETSMGRMTVA